MRICKWKGLTSVRFLEFMMDMVVPIVAIFRKKICIIICWRNIEKLKLRMWLWKVLWKSIEIFWKELRRTFMWILVDLVHWFYWLLVIFFLLNIKIDNKLIFINTGDSRGMISKKNGKEVIQSTEDHKPHYKGEYTRIFQHSGQLYRFLY